MKHLSILSGTLLLTVLVCLTACQAPYAPAQHSSGPDNSYSSRIGKVSRIIGTGQVRINNRIVHEGAVMLSGDHIETVGDARAALKLANGGKVLFDADTDPILEFISKAYCKLRILINVGSILVDTPCEIQAETGSGAVIKTLKTRFHVTVTSEWTALTVIKGKMTIRSNVGGIQVVPAGYQCMVFRDRPAPLPVRVETWEPIDWACRLDPRLCREYPSSQRNMPMLLDLPLRKATTLLKDAGLRLGRIKMLRTRDKDLDGRVARQTPKAGTQIQPDTVTGLTVYRHERRQKPMLTVPHLEGMHIKNVRVKLEQAGLKLGRTYTDSTTARHEIGIVFRQKPAAGTALAPGTTVDIWVFQKEIPRQPYIKNPVLHPPILKNNSVE
ncbi:MAG: PASTA domain-containing protein [Desulfobacterium sp.]|nr:PASTA domain-containing protein [Desulfobacterium sp.]